MRRAVTESNWQSTVTDLAELCGWAVMHVRAVTTDRGRTLTPTTIAGWPDLTLWRPGRILYRELKTDTGRLTPDQRAVLASLQAAGGDVAVWRPRDWVDVEATLRGVSGGVSSAPSQSHGAGVATGYGWRPPSRRAGH